MRGLQVSALRAVAMLLKVNILEIYLLFPAPRYYPFSVNKVQCASGYLFKHEYGAGSDVKIDSESTIIHVHTVG